MEYDTSMTPRPTGINRSAFLNRNRRQLLIALVAGLVLLLIVAASVVAIVLLVGNVNCGNGEFKCADGQICVPSSKLCDGISDCGDSSDETDCTTGTTVMPTTIPTTMPTTMPATTTSPTPGIDRCILLIGGSGYYGSGDLVEYYHPTMEECDTENIDKTKGTSGCYLSDTQQIAIREAYNKPPMVYGLRDSSATQLPFPLPYSYTAGSTAASISPTKCLSCGVEYKHDWSNNCYQFDSSSPTEWTTITPLPRALSYSASVSLGKSYYVIGGNFAIPAPSKTLFRYSVDEREWYKEPPMAQGRKHHSAAALSATEFMVCGGTTTGNDCEVFNTTQKKWRRVGNLNERRERFALATFNGIVYAIGGIGDGKVVTDSVEAYDERTEKWTEVKKLKHQRYSFVSVVV